MENMVIISLDEYNELKNGYDDFNKIYKASTFGVSTITFDGEKILNIFNERYCYGNKIFKDLKTR